LGEFWLISCFHSSTVEVEIFLSKWELRIPKQPKGEVKLIWPLGVGQWPVMLFGSKVR